MSSSSFSGKVVEPYAEALMSVAQSQNLVEEFGEEIHSLLALLEESPELKGFLENPILKAEDKKVVLSQILGEQANPYFRNFLMLLVDRRRIVFIEAIAQKYLERLRQLNNTVLAFVTSAVEMKEAQCQAVSDKVKQITGARAVELKASVDPDLIGGVIIKVGSQVFDASLRGQLRRISLNLIGAG